jgi:hypothetical protein
MKGLLRRAWLGFVAVLAIATAAQAAGTTFQSYPSGHWETPANWANGVPGDGTDAYVDNDATVLMTADGTTHEAYYLYLGRDNSGGVAQTAGVLNVGAALALGDGSNAVGTYELSGDATLAVSVYEIVGWHGSGTFAQTGGAHAVGAFLSLGYSAGGSGAYGLSGNGALSVGTSEYVGRSGSGAFTQTGGTHTVWIDLYLGYSGGAAGTYELSGDATLAVTGHEFLGHDGSATFVHTGGTHGVAGNLYLGRFISGTGAYELSGDATLAVGGDEIVGSYGSGTVTQTGGTHTVGGNLAVGSEAGSTGAYSISGGLLEVNGLEIGPQGSGALDLNGSAAHVKVTGLMKLGPLGSMSAVSGSRIDLARDFENASIDGAAFGTFGLAAGSHFNMTGDGTTDQKYEAGGGDCGAIGPGYYQNSALGDFQILTGTTTLVDAVANDPDATGTANALYVDTLRIADGATLELNGQNLYYHNWDGSAGWGGSLVNSGAAAWAPGPGDFDENAAVGLGDFSLFAGMYGLTEGEIGWDANADIDRNGAVGLGDFSLFAGLYKTTYTYGGPGAPVTSVPEPATVAFLGLGLPVLLRWRRRSR